MKIGDKMPEFQIMDQNGNLVESSALLNKGKSIVLYTYPKDNTSGCTAEACSFRDAYAELQEAGYTVIGVSKDSVKSHAGFRAKHSLPFTLLADTETSLLQQLGAWGEKKLYGKTYMGALRKTYIFTPDGTLARIIEKVDTKRAAQQILDEK